MVKVKRRSPKSLKTNYDAVHQKLDGENPLARWRASSVLSPGSKNILSKYEDLQKGLLGLKEPKGKKRSGKGKRRSGSKSAKRRSRSKSAKRRSRSKSSRRRRSNRK